MMVLAGAPLGLRFELYDPAADACSAGGLRGEGGCGHLRFRERTRRQRAVPGRPRAGLPAAGRAGRGPGPAERKDPVPAAGHPAAGLRRHPQPRRAG
ncbi:hypothetical protein G6F66_015178 [Rhizopus arrhizus]|nr:hypothetical protein G6F66_015178 [Rhizopus arrhizus]